MKHEIEFKGFGTNEGVEPKEGIRELIETLLSRVEKRAQSFPPDTVFARVVVERNPAHKLFHISVKLDVPEKTLATKKETHDLEAGLRDAFAEIQRQLEEHKATLRGEPQWKQMERREQIRHNKSRTPISDIPETFFAVINPYLSRLKEFVGRVIDFAESRGDLVPGQLTVEDVVDATLVKAYSEYLMNPTPGNIQAWLIRLATKEIEAEIRQTYFDRNRTVHLETHIPETPPREEVNRLGEDIFYFYQPDEDLKMEDIVPDVAVATPELEAEREELRRCVRTIFNSMPEDSRRILLRRYIQGMTVKEIAKTAGASEAEIQRTLDNAREYLRERLIESGCTLAAVESEEALRTEVEATSKNLAG